MLKKNINFPLRFTPGFTLVETLVVIAIIGVLSGTVLLTVSGIRLRARDANRIMQVRALEQALLLYAEKYGDFSSITGLAQNDCSDGLGGLITSFPGNPPFCQAVFYSNDNDRPIGPGHNSWQSLQEYLDEFLPNFPNDPKNNYDDWQHFPASPAVCSSGCDAMSPLTDGFMLAVVSSINVRDDICGSPADMGYFIETAVEDANNSSTLVNKGYSCFGEGNLKYLKVNWGVF